MLLAADASRVELEQLRARSCWRPTSMQMKWNEIEISNYDYRPIARLCSLGADNRSRANQLCCVVSSLALLIEFFARPARSSRRVEESRSRAAEESSSRGAEERRSAKKLVVRLRIRYSFSPSAFSATSTSSSQSAAPI